MAKGFSSGSLLAICTVAVRAPPAVGTKATKKVVVAPGASVVAPGPPAVKSPGLAPVFDTVSPVRLVLPAFLIVKVCAVLLALVTITPKSRVPAALWRSLAGEVPAPVKTEISGKGGEATQPRLWSE